MLDHWLTNALGSGELIKPGLEGVEELVEDDYFGISIVFTHVRLRVSLICIVVGQGNPTRGPE